MTEKSALIIAYPMVFFRYIFIIPISILNSSVNYFLKLFGLGNTNTHDTHTEDEIRIILEQSQSSGIMSFRGLLLMENIRTLETLT
jgi:CBS domain containing-hemolysin-like protein